MQLITSPPIFLFVYDFLTGLIEFKTQKINHLKYVTPSGQFIIFDAKKGNLEWETPCFLLENIFYIQRGNKIYFSENINSFKGLSDSSEFANRLLNIHGFLPHSMTQFTDVKIICSFLKYSVTLNGVEVAPCYVNKIRDNYLYSIDDLFVALKSVFLRQIQRINTKNLILPLSGGMDSRLLLNMLLDIEDIDVELFTVGTPSSGDVRVAIEIIKKLRLKNNHVIVNLESLDKGDLLKNYSASNYLLPLDRILTVPLNCFFKESTVVSGLYGDVIFADNERHSVSYGDYVCQEGLSATNDLDAKIISAYNQLPRLQKLQRTLLRCQKLTRQSFPINQGFNYIAPFVDPEVIAIASAIQSPNIYANLVRRYMRKDLQGIMHQSSLSYFTHAPLLRKFERKLFKLMRHPYRRPYYDVTYLSSIGVTLNEAPFIKL